MSEPPVNEQAFNEGFLTFLREQLLKRPAMYVGTVNFDLVCSFINGLICGYADTGRGPKLVDWEFNRFVQKKYGIGPAAVWMTAYQQCPSRGALSEEEKLAILLADFEEFTNPLTRMVMGIDQ